MFIICISFLVNFHHYFSKIYVSYYLFQNEYPVVHPIVSCISFLIDFYLSDENHKTVITVS